MVEQGLGHVLKHVCPKATSSPEFFNKTQYRSLRLCFLLGPGSHGPPLSQQLTLNLHARCLGDGGGRVLTVLVVKCPGARVSKANKLDTLNVGYLYEQYPKKSVRKQQKTSMGADPRGKWMNGSLRPVSMGKAGASEFIGKRERDRGTERERGRQTDRWLMHRDFHTL